MSCGEIGSAEAVSAKEPSTPPVTASAAPPRAPRRKRSALVRETGTVLELRSSVGDGCGPQRTTVKPMHDAAAWPEYHCPARPPSGQLAAGTTHHRGTQGTA